MRIVVLGGTGGVGQAIVRQAVGAGYTVVALARDPSKLATSPSVVPVTADLMEPNPKVLLDAMEGADAVLSALGPRGKSDTGILSNAATATLLAMGNAGIRRYIGVSAAPVGTVPSALNPNPPRHDPGDDLIARYVMMPIVHRVFGTVYRDAATMEDAVRASDLDWTLVRPPRLTNGPRTGTYRTATDRNVRGGRSISRADVADAMLSSLTEPATVGHTLGVAR
jgi:uncharacterized protein YbjT (DUF2867 family)